MGGKTRTEILASDKLAPDPDDIYGDEAMDEHFGTAMGVVGLNYSKALGFNSFIKVTLAASREHQTNHQDKVVRHIENVLKQTYVSGAEPPIQETYQLGFLPIFYYKIDF